MIDIQFISRDSPPEKTEVWRYGILDTEVRSNEEISSLRPFAVRNQATRPAGIATTPESIRHNAPPGGAEVSSSIVVHDHTIHLRCRSIQDGIRLCLDKHTEIDVSTVQGTMDVNSKSTIPRTLLEQLVLGPGLVLMMTGRRVHFLHGSAIRTPAGVLVFVGSSGSGKSTLARELANFNSQWQLLADDIVAINTGGEHPVCLPRFPQPKLTSSQQPIHSGQILPLIGIFTINPRDGHEHARLQVDSPAHRAVDFINHVMGSGSGIDNLERNILEATSVVVDDVDGGRLMYPHGPGGPGEVSDILSDRYLDLMS